MDIQSKSGSGSAVQQVRPGLYLLLFWPTLALTIPTIYWSPMWQATLHYDALQMPFEGAIAAASGLLAAVIGAPILVTNALRQLRQGEYGTALLLALAVTVSTAFALVVQIAQWAGLGLKGQDFWWQSASLIAAVLIGRWFELRGALAAASPFAVIFSRLPESVRVVSSDGETTTRLVGLGSGSVVRCSPGEIIPVDGKIVNGEADIDESYFTGAANSVRKTSGDYVLAGSLNLKPLKADLSIHDLLERDTSGAVGSIDIEVAKPFDESLLASIIANSQLAAHNQSSLERRMKLAATVYFWVAVGGSLLTFLGWVFLGHVALSFAVERAVAVLAVAIPTAIAIAVPSVSFYAIANAASLGVFVKSRLAFDDFPKVKHLLIDKTGIITTGERVFVDARITRRGGLENVDELLAVAGGLEFGVEHGVARAILQETYRRGIIPIGVKDLMTVPGIGVSGRWEEHRLSAGGPALLTRQKIDIDVLDLYQVDAMNTAGQTVIFVVRDSILLGYISVSDEVRATSADAIWELQRLNYRVGLITGDAFGVASSVAKELAIEEVFAEVLPADKADTVERLQNDGELVALVGEVGAEEAALEKANVSVAISSREDLATAKADIVLLGGDASAIARLAHLAQDAREKTRTNLIWAVGFNSLALPLAAGVLAPVGTVFIPALASALATVASLIVWLNARSLEGKR